ncbi:response regulator transcription factor [Collinsella intestinalis]|uniref:response regulator transcription factor n=1 Tax=Collinsella intestinalis TaxID=147207 RepID=UPI001957FA35|nr:response regulator transcription factor [Collinsella intestinalis]MBM6943197.1 response regulator transcription factor [Collinsella intestinalis]
MRVAIIDDDELVCESLGIILGAEDDIDIVGTGVDGDAAVRLYAQMAPDIVLMDIQMPGRDGLSAAQEILGGDPAARIVFLTTFSDDEYIVRALALGARGYLIKQDVAAVAPALRAVMGGQSVLEGEVLARVSRISAPAVPAPAAPASTRPADPFACLTEREREVAELIADGLDNREIAQTAYLSEGTVRNHISAILSKLHLKNRTQIAIAYWRRG